MVEVSARRIAALLGKPLCGDDLRVARAVPLSKLQPGTVAFAKHPGLPIPGGGGALLIVPEGHRYGETGNALIVVDNPRLAFARVVSAFFAPPAARGRAATAVVAKTARLDEGVSLGHHAVIGDDVRIGARTVIEDNVVVRAGTRIGSDCRIGPGSVVGEHGFGTEWASDDDVVMIPHIGNVIIEDQVWIGANCVIARGTLDSTVIGRSTKISQHVNIGHNTVIGRACVVTGHATISGSVRVGNRCWIGPNAAIVQGVTIGDGARIGIGVTVLADVPAGAVVVPEVGVVTRPDAAAGTANTSAAASRPARPAGAIDEIVRRTIREVLRLDEATPLPSEAGPGYVPAWDSLGNLNILMALQERLGVTFSPSDMVSAASVGGFVRTVERLLGRDRRGGD